MICAKDPDKYYDDYVSKKGNPLRTFDKKIFEGLCHIQCTVREMCTVFRCSNNTLDRWCWHTYGQSVADVWEWLSLDGHASLRRTQWQQGKKHWGMAIWLGKQYLGQTDKTTVQEQHITKIDTVLDGLHDRPAGSRATPEPLEDYVEPKDGSIQSQADPKFPTSDSSR